MHITLIARPFAPVLALVIALPSACNAAQAADECAALARLHPADTSVRSAAVVPAGTAIGDGLLPLPACRVQGTARPSPDSDIEFEVWLPLTASAWTGRMKLNGTGGFAGATPYARLAQDIGDGFVTAGSNMGHDGGESATWTLGHPEKVRDWGLRAHRSVGLAAKALAAAYYGKPVKYAYFEGCSNGGRQAMMLAQNDPELFDGIVAGAPSMFYPDLLMWLLWTGKTLAPTAPFGPAAISEAQRAAITQRVLQACDANDGLVDGQITNPRACQFDIATLGPAGDRTLSADELKAAQRMYGGSHRDWNDLASEQRYPGAMPGSEADWSPHFADHGGYGPFIGHFVEGALTPPYDWRRDINWNGAYDRVKAALAPTTAAPSPDLRRFSARGGKLIQTQGWNDAVVPPEGSIGYWLALTQWERLRQLPAAEVERQIAQLTPEAVAATAQALGPQVRQYHRLFMLPATGHCGGGTGPNAVGGGMPEPPAAYRDAQHHMVSAVVQWVEQGIAPEQIIATRFDAAGRPERSRPCALTRPKRSTTARATSTRRPASNASCRAGRRRASRPAIWWWFATRWPSVGC